MQFFFLLLFFYLKYGFFCTISNSTRTVKSAGADSTKKIEHHLYVASFENHASVIPTTMSQVLRFLKHHE